MRGAQYLVVFPEEVSRALREFSRQEGATLFMTAMAGFHALLRRCTGQNDVLVGTPIAGRSRVELEPLIGFFVNMIPIRTSFRSDTTFRQLVRQVRESSFAAYMHQELPFDKLVEELQPKRAPGRNPIFQAILAFNNDVPEMEIAKVNLPAGVPVSADVKFDLEVHLFDGPNGLTGTFVYSPELFDVSLISRMAAHFPRLFEKALAAPDKELSAISLLDEAEYTQVVETWNNTNADFPDQQCIHEIVQQHAEQRPDAIALESGDNNITYAQLNNRANRLAHRLREYGAGQESFVGVMLERSADLIVALLATVKAGAVYVPINLTDPPARIRFILEDAGIKTLVTSKKIAESLRDKDLTIVCVDDDNPRDDVSETSIYVDPDNLAYLMYTSGSTGTPKGVGITHRNIAALVKNTNYAKLNSEEIFLQLAPSSFDASTFEIWACLLNGARLVVYPPGTPSLSELGEFVARTQVTTLFLTTGLFHQFVDTNVKGIGAVKQLLTGGDILSPVHINKAVEQIDDCLFVNCYGPTEATVMACAYQVGPNRPATSVPIGRPISNSRVYIINNLQPAGVGERGELFIGGAGLGRGYHNRPDLTAERFVPDPYGPQPGARLYRTGDAARYLNQGLIQFLGRVDNQVKISGFRIEPGEIETALCTHPGITSALVLAREDTPGDKRLVAYVVSGEQSAPAPEDLRNYLRERVPEYMVPSAVMILDALPLTPHGKVDHNALPVPQFVSRTGRDYVAPRNGLQQQLVDIWEELFKLHPIGITDDFFELGGHSLMMIMLVARIEERLGKRVTMAELFTEPTIEHLSELIGHGKETLFQSLVVAMQPEGNNPAFFSPHASGGNLWCYKDLVRYIGSEQPFYGVQPHTP
jgi:aspartate racemase